ncbi:MAG: chromate transporter [Sphaerochaetaceae bacterium]|nr:chromate transporter [Sphaerochaetaceae bacterium]
MTDKNNKTTLWELFISFAKIGVLTFGGGMSMLPMLQRECVESRKWATDEEMLDYFAIGQCTPGIIAVNTATIIGNKQRGLPGALVSTAGVIFPSVLIITVLASIILKYNNNSYVQKAFEGIRVAVCALILKSILTLAKKADKNMLYLLVTVGAFVALFFYKASPIAAVVATIIIGIIAYYAEKNSPKKNEEGK